ncbi:MAG: hypothetical protein Q9199_006880 [Rusavskia elegans]
MTEVEYFDYHIQRQQAANEPPNSSNALDLPPERSKEEVFEELREQSLQEGHYYEAFSEKYQWVGEKLIKIKRDYPYLGIKTASDYFDWLVERHNRNFRSSVNEPVPTDEEFWKAAYDYDPLGPNPNSDLYRMIASGRKGPLTLGKLYGETVLRLVPAVGVLPAVPLDFEPTFGFAATDGEAIYYPDGHPTEQMLSSINPGVSNAEHPMKYEQASVNLLHRQTPSPQQAYAPPSSKSVATPKVGPQQDDLLRRCLAIGWIYMQDPDGDWTKTGHVLVIDMDDRATRHRQPWLILAPDWPTDGEEPEDGTFTFHAEEDVDRGSKWLPGQFGPRFDFLPVRLGGHRQANPSDKGPGLVRAMEWYWDPVAQQEVCYTKDRLEYMRYDRKTKRYTYPDFSKMSFAGEQGLFGELQEPPTLEVEGNRIGLRARLDETSEVDGGRAIHAKKGFL